MNTTREPTDAEVLAVITEMVGQDVRFHCHGSDDIVYTNDPACRISARKSGHYWIAAKFIIADRLSRKSEPATRLPESAKPWRTTQGENDWERFRTWWDRTVYGAQFDQLKKLFEPAPEPVKVTWRDVYDMKLNCSITDTYSYAICAGYRYARHVETVYRVTDSGFLKTGITIKQLDDGTAFEEASK